MLGGLEETHSTLLRAGVKMLGKQKLGRGKTQRIDVEVCGYVLWCVRVIVYSLSGQTGCGLSVLQWQATLVRNPNLLQFQNEGVY